MAWPYSNEYNPYIFPYSNPYQAYRPATNHYEYKTLVFPIPNVAVGTSTYNFIHTSGYEVNSYGQTVWSDGNHYVESVNSNGSISTNNVNVDTSTYNIDVVLTGFGDQGFAIIKIDLIGNGLIMYTLERKYFTDGIYNNGYYPGRGF